MKENKSVEESFYGNLCRLIRGLVGAQESDSDGDIEESEDCGKSEDSGIFGVDGSVVECDESSQDSDTDTFLALSSWAYETEECCSTSTKSSQKCCSAKIAEDCCRYEPKFVLRRNCFKSALPNLSPWSAAVWRRRIERHCRSAAPFVRYDLEWVKVQLARALQQEQENLKSRSPSPSRSSSTISSLDELSSHSTATGSAGSCSSVMVKYGCEYASNPSQSPSLGYNINGTRKEVEGNSANSNGNNRVMWKQAGYSTRRSEYKAKGWMSELRAYESGELLDALCVEETKLQDYVQRAYEHSRIFEILAQSANRFRISPSSYGLGVPLSHLNTCWPKITSDSDVGRQQQTYCEFKQFKLPPNSKMIKQQHSHAGRKKKRHSAGVVPENRPSVELEVEENREHSDEETHDTQNTTNAACAPPPASSFNRSGTFEVSKMDVLSEEMWDFHNTVTQSEALLNRKLHLRDMLYYCISPVFPMCGLYVVGSSLNGFGSNASDMDLCLMISQKDIDQRTDAVVVLGMIKSALGGVAWVREQQLIIAKVPILRIRFTEPFGEITVDLNANNSVAIRNTHLLCYYSSFDWRVRPLVSVVKEWAKRRDINDANRSTFTSYSLVLMVIHYLQCGANPAVLPSLQDLYPKRFNHRTDVRTLNVSIPLESPACGDWHFSEANTLGELLLGFLEYYAFKFDYVHDAISVRLASKIERSFVARQRSPYNNSIAQWNCICIEEPFTLSNTAHSVHSQMVFDAIREAFVDGFDELDTNRDLNAFLNAAPIRIGPHLTTPNGSGVQLNALSEAGYGLRRGSQDHALFLLDTSSDPSSTASSPRSTPSNIEEHGGVTSSESTDGDFIRHSTETSTTASDQESLGGSACAGRQRRRVLLTDQPQEMVNNASRPNAFRGRDHYMYNSKSPKWSGEDSVLEHEESQGRGRRRRNTTRRGVVQVNGGATGFKTTARARFN